MEIEEVLLLVNFHEWYQVWLMTRIVRPVSKPIIKLWVKLSQFERCMICTTKS